MPLYGAHATLCAFCCGLRSPCDMTLTATAARTRTQVHLRQATVPRSRRARCRPGCSSAASPEHQADTCAVTAPASPLARCRDSRLSVQRCRPPGCGAADPVARLREFGLAGVCAYGLLNTVYYTASFLILAALRRRTGALSAAHVRRLQSRTCLCSDGGASMSSARVPSQVWAWRARPPIWRSFVR